MPSDQIEPFSVQDFGPPGWIPRPPTGITTPKLNIDTQHVSLENVSLASNMATFGIYLKSLGGRYFDMESFFSTFAAWKFWSIPCLVATQKL